MISFTRLFIVSLCYSTTITSGWYFSKVTTTKSTVAATSRSYFNNNFDSKFPISTTTVRTTKKRQINNNNNNNIFNRITKSSSSSLLMMTSSSTTNNNNNNNNDIEELTHDEIKRYSRHLVLNDVGMIGQKKLKNSSILVIGAGGLGSPCLLYLAAAGIGHIGIVDADVVDESNLQRQIIHGTSTIDISKCQSAYTRIKDINPNVNVKLYEEEFTSSSALRIVTNGFDTNIPYDIIVDGSDNFPTKYLINDVCEIVGIPWVYSAILAFEGQLSTFNYPVGIGPSYRDLLPTPPPPGEVPSCAEGGVVGVLPGTMGCLQATEVIKLLLGRQPETELVTGRVLVFDALKMSFKDIGLQRNNKENHDPITELIDYKGFCAGPKTTTTTTTTTTDATTTDSTTSSGGRTMDEVEESSSSTDESIITYHSITPKECLSKLVNDNWTPYVLDVRLQTEHDIVALPFTDCIAPHRTVQLNHIPQKSDCDILVYCKAGVRGKKACQRLIDLGVNGNRLYNLDGGIMKWQQDIDSNMPRY